MKKLHSLIAASLTVAALSMANVGMAQTAESTATASPAAEMADGEVRKIDKEAQKLTIKHAPLKNLDMPGMTMVFQVQDPAMLDKVQAGDKVRFSADKLNGKFTVTNMELAR